MRFQELIREVKDFPQPGINFRDITPLLQSPAAYKQVIDLLADRYKHQAIDAIVGIESRGFLIAAPLARELEMPLLLIRKQGKLPFKTKSITYALEYGVDALEIHKDGVSKSDKIIIIDDLVATGGTLEAAAKLIESFGANILELAVVIELIDLDGRNKLHKWALHSLCQL